MTINQIKNELNNHVGKKVTIKYNLGRNKYEKYNVIIKKLYNNIFLVELTLDNNIFIKSFSYTDVITKTIRIDF